MSRPVPLILLLLVLALWLAGGYGVRYALMENGQWVALCVDDALRWQCQARATLGWMIHVKLLGWSALVLAGLAFVLPGRAGWGLALLGLFFGLPALALYNTTLAVFAVLLAGLRLVRARPAD